ncbi:hypothetical protein RHMOL_Rhmol02G0106400 [Rhododendron molle]|uniref:Uncharacterized protein n=1 Tax=Rhododendron molle TaxID=49168 RepID=A0ACC0PQ95_RHOML|nr:hypothetical protein RHMOL_Rhmol02G0106400 [Rhododendron molle]
MTCNQKSSESEDAVNFVTPLQMKDLEIDLFNKLKLALLLVIFCTTSTWEALRYRADRVLPWAAVIWFPKGVPRELYKLVCSDTECVLCSRPTETLQHLFFECGFSDRFGMLYQLNFRFEEGQDNGIWS